MHLDIKADTIDYHWNRYVSKNDPKTCWLYCPFRDIHGTRENTDHLSRVDNKGHHWSLPTLYQPWQQGSWGQYGAHPGPTGPGWAPCWSHELCYLALTKSMGHWKTFLGEISKEKLKAFSWCAKLLQPYLTGASELIERHEWNLLYYSTKTQFQI